MKRLTFILVFGLFLSFSAYAQNDGGDISLPHNLRYGNNNAAPAKKVNLFIGANLSTNILSQFSVAPEIGIYATNWLGIGIGPRYEMTYNSYYDEIFHAYGGSLFTEFIVNDYIIGDIGYEYINYPVVTAATDGSASYTLSRDNAHALMLAGGVRFSVSERLSLYLKYVIYPLHSKYENNYYSSFVPMFARFGLTFDL